MRPEDVIPDEKIKKKGAQQYVVIKFNCCEGFKTKALGATCVFLSMQRPFDRQTLVCKVQVTTFAIFIHKRLSVLGVEGKLMECDSYLQS